MKHLIKIQRYEFGLQYCKGHLFVDGRLLLTTLEPTDRGLSNQMNLKVIKEKKLDHITAIPIGTYKTDTYYSPKNKCYVPILLDVKGFTAIEMHIGNSPRDTSGCILVGLTDVPNEGKIGMSAPAFKVLMAYINDFKNEEFDIEISRMENEFMVAENNYKIFKGI
jgi:hypothetical protein